MPSRFFLYTILFAGLFFSCKKDRVVVKESPFFELFKESSIVIDTVQTAVDTWEYGFSFSPVTNGKITQLEIKLPTTGSFTVTLWDLSGATPAKLQSKVINEASKHATTANDIPEVAVNQGVKYGVSILANSFYRLTKPGSAKFVFPKTIGNITVQSFNEAINNTSLATFPANTNDTRIAPCVDVIFIAD